MEKARVAIILAAGLGSRLAPLTKTDHKCMTKVCGIPIIYNALKRLEEKKFDEVIIVVGYLKEQLKTQITEFDLNLKIMFAENNIYDQTNTIYSLIKGLDKVTKYDELYVIEGDVFFEKTVLDRLVNSSYENATVLELYNNKLEGTFAQVGANGCVNDWRHKSDQEEGYKLEDKFKTVNLHKFSRKFVVEKLKPMLEEVMNDDGIKKPIEKAMKRIVEKYPDIIKGEILCGEKWYEIDDVNDLEIAETLFG